MKNYAEFDRKGCFSYKKIYAVTIPILLSMLMEHIIGMTDTAFLGRVSEVALGASALGTVYFLIFFVLKIRSHTPRICGFCATLFLYFAKGACSRQSLERHAVR